MGKKVITVVLALMMVLMVFTACAKTEAPAEPSKEAPAEASKEAPAEPSKEAPAEQPAEGPKTFTIGYLGWDTGQDWNVSTLAGLQWGADQKGCEVIVKDPKLNAETQVSQAQELINQGVDCIAMFPVTPESGATIVRMCNEANIPIAVDNTFLPDDGSAGKMVGQVACQYGDIGYAAIQWAANNVPDAKLLYVHGGPGEGVYEAYQIGVDKALADFKDKIEMVGLVNGEWVTEASYNVTQDFITSGKADFNVVFANNDAQAKGVYQALKENGMETIPIISTGGSNEGLQMLKDGQEAANMTAPANIQGIIEFGMLWAYMNGETWGDPKIPLPVIPIDKNNIAEWIKWDDMELAYAYVVENIGEYVP
jgi:ABC-type sugar transport system substrate-binding protein